MPLCVVWRYPHLDVAAGQREKQAPKFALVFVYLSELPFFCLKPNNFKAGMSERKRPVLKPPKSKATSTTAAVNTLEVTTKAVVSTPVLEEEPELQDNATTPTVDFPSPRRKHRRAQHQHHHLHEQRSLSDVREDLHIDSQRRILRSRESTNDGGSIVDASWKWKKNHNLDDAVDNTLKPDSAQLMGRTPTTAQHSPLTDDDIQHPSEAMAALKDAASGMLHTIDVAWNI